MNWIRWMHARVHGLGIEYRISNIEYRILIIEYGISNIVYRISNFDYRILNIEYWKSNTEYRIWHWILTSTGSRTEENWDWATSSTPVTTTNQLLSPSATSTYQTPGCTPARYSTNMATSRPPPYWPSMVSDNLHVIAVYSNQCIYRINFYIRFCFTFIFSV